MAKGKRGRPRKPPPFRDKGTPELRIRRAIIVNGGNPDKASDPIDACEERGIINSDMSLAAHQYSTIYYKIFGKPFHSINYDKLLNRTEGFVNAATKVKPAVSGPKAVANAAPAVLNPTAAPFAPAPAPKNDLPSIGKALFASFNLLFVPFTV